MLPIGSIHILEAIEKFRFDGPTHCSHQETTNQKSFLYGSLANQQLSYKKKSENRARSAENCMCSQQVINTVDESQGFTVYGWVLALFSDLLWLLLFEEAFFKVMKLSVSILEADSVHLCHLQHCFSIDRIRSIYGHTNIDDILCHGDRTYLHALTNKMVSNANSLSIEEYATGGNLAEHCWVPFKLQQILSRAHWSLILWWWAILLTEAGFD